MLVDTDYEDANSDSERKKVMNEDERDSDETDEGRSFKPKFSVTINRVPLILCGGIDRPSAELDVFPRSLPIFIVQCTNMHLSILRRDKNCPGVQNTDTTDMLVLVVTWNQVQE